MEKYKIGSAIFCAQPKFEYTKKVFNDFLYSGSESPLFFIDINDSDFNAVKERFPDRTDGMIESIAILIQFAKNAVLSGSGVMFHASTVVVDGVAYLFTAPSGTGKSTHASLWKKLLKSRVSMLNDDKPMLSVENNEVYVIGTPWKGKNNLGKNQKVKVKAICNLERAENNSVSKLEKERILPLLLNQTIRFGDLNFTEKLLSVLGEIEKHVNFFNLKCNMDISAAKLSYETMSGEKL